MGDTKCYKLGNSNFWVKWFFNQPNQPNTIKAELISRIHGYFQNLLGNTYIDIPTLLKDVSEVYEIVYETLKSKFGKDFFKENMLIFESILISRGGADVEIKLKLVDVNTGKTQGVIQGYIEIYQINCPDPNIPIS